MRRRAGPPVQRARQLRAAGKRARPPIAATSHRYALTDGYRGQAGVWSAALARAAGDRGTQAPQAAARKVATCLRGKLTHVRAGRGTCCTMAADGAACRPPGPRQAQQAPVLCLTDGVQILGIQLFAVLESRWQLVGGGGMGKTRPLAAEAGAQSTPRQPPPLPPSRRSHLAAADPQQTVREGNPGHDMHHS